MVLTQERQQRLGERLEELADYGGITRVAELAGVTIRVITKARAGGNVRVETMESIIAGLIAVEAEREAKLKTIEQALT